MPTFTEETAKAGAQYFVYADGEKKNKLGSLKKERLLTGFWVGALFVTPEKVFPTDADYLCVNKSDILGGGTQPPEPPSESSNPPWFKLIAPDGSEDFYDKRA